MTQKIDFQSLFQNTPSAMLILSPSFEIVAVTDSYLKATMTKRQEIIGRGLFEVFPDNPNDPMADGVSNLRASLNRVLTHKATDSMAIQKYDIRKPNSEEFEVRYWSPTNTPILDEKDQVQLIIHGVSDVTEFVTLKQTTGLLEAETFKRAKELEAANKELEAFSYSVSHDLRAPLRSMSGFSQILIEQYAQNLAPEAMDYLKRISFSAKKMGLLIDGLLQLSRLNRKIISSQEINISLVAEHIFKDLSLSEQGSKTEFLFQKDISTEGDPELLQAVMTNLLNNAWKFTRKTKSPKIEFGIKESKGKSAFFIKDNGAGFSMDYVDKLFGVFQRLHSVNEFEGTGVGLATVQRIIHRHGGEIWAEGVPEQGATFYFTLKTKD